MTDYRDKRDRGEPAVEFRWDPLQLASDKTFSTTVRIFVSGWWPEGRSDQVLLSYYEKSLKPADGNPVRIQKGRGTFPLTGLEPGKHYHVAVYIKDRLPVQDMIMVPELPKPVELLKSKPQIKILHLYRRLSRLEVVLQRIGKDGKPEDGEISVLDFEQGGVVFGDTPGDFPFRKKEWGMVVVFLPYFDYPRQVTFFLPDNPDDPAVKAVVDVPARVAKKEKKAVVAPSRPSLWQEMKETYREERNKGKTPAFLLKIQRRKPLISL